MLNRVLITGGGKRIGAALVRAFAELDFEVYIHCHRSQKAAEELRSQLQDPDRHSIVNIDLSSAERSKYLSELPPMDLVINNASCYRLTKAGESESAQNRQLYWQVNYFAPLEVIQWQKNSHPGKSLAITMLDCDVLDPAGGVKEFVEAPAGVDSYLSTRIKLARKLLELARSNAPQRIAAIAPGPVLPPVNCPTAGMTRILDRTVTKRPVGVNEIVNTALYLWQNPALTGVIIPVDGGMHLQ